MVSPHWNLNFTDLTRCCCTMQFEARLSIVSLEKSNTHTLFTMNVYCTKVPDLPELGVYYARSLPPEWCDNTINSNTMSSSGKHKLNYALVTDSRQVEHAKMHLAKGLFNELTTQCNKLCCMFGASIGFQPAHIILNCFVLYHVINHNTLNF